MVTPTARGAATSAVRRRPFHQTYALTRERQHPGPKGLRHTGQRNLSPTGLANTALHQRSWRTEWSFHLRAQRTPRPLHQRAQRTARLHRVCPVSIALRASLPLRGGRYAGRADAARWRRPVLQ